LDENRDTDKRIGYWNCQSEDLILREQEEPKYRSGEKVLQGKKKKERKFFKVETNSPLKYYQSQDYLEIAMRCIAPITNADTQK
jgi:hypothetical protein